MQVLVLRLVRRQACLPFLAKGRARGHTILKVSMVTQLFGIELSRSQKSATHRSMHQVHVRHSSEAGGNASMMS